MGTIVHPILQATAAGNELDVIMILESLGHEASKYVLIQDSKGRNSIHMAAMGNSSAIMKHLLMSHLNEIMEFREKELTRLEMQKQVTINNLKNNHSNLKFKDIKFEIIDEWFNNEIKRVNRLVEFKKELFWLKALKSLDNENQSPLHYLAANDSMNAKDIFNVVISTGQGIFKKFNEEKVPTLKENKKVSNFKTKNVFDNSNFFNSNSIYSTITGHDLSPDIDSFNSTNHFMGLKSLNNTKSSNLFAEPKFSSESTIDTLSDHEFMKEMKEIDGLITPSDTSINFEIIIPWLLRNMKKRATDMSSKGKYSNNIRELTESIAGDDSFVLIAPQFRVLLAQLGIRVTHDIIREVCRLYAADSKTSRDKWTKAFERDLESKMAESESKSKAYDEEQHSSYGSKFKEVYDKYDGYEAKDKSPKKTKKNISNQLLLLPEEEDLAVDMERLIRDIENERGLISIDGLLKATNKREFLIERNKSDKFRRENKSVEDSDDDHVSPKDAKLSITEQKTGYVGEHETQEHLPSVVTVGGIMKMRSKVVDMKDNLGRLKLLENKADITTQTFSGLCPFTVAKKESLVIMQTALVKWLNSNKCVNRTISRYLPDLIDKDEKIKDIKDSIIKRKQIDGKSDNNDIKEVQDIFIQIFNSFCKSVNYDPKALTSSDYQILSSKIDSYFFESANQEGRLTRLDLEILLKSLNISEHEHYAGTLFKFFDVKDNDSINLSALINSIKPEKIESYQIKSLVDKVNKAIAHNSKINDADDLDSNHNDDIMYSNFFCEYILKSKDGKVDQKSFKDSLIALNIDFSDKDASLLFNHPHSLEKEGYLNAEGFRRIMTEFNSHSVVSNLNDAEPEGSGYCEFESKEDDKATDDIRWTIERDNSVQNVKNEIIEEKILALSEHLSNLQGSRWSYSQTSLAWAVNSGSVKLVEQQIKAGVSPNIPDSVGRCPLHICSGLTRERKSKYDSSSCIPIESILVMMETLIQNGAVVNTQSISGRTPLHELFCSNQNDMLPSSRDDHAKNKSLEKSSIHNTIVDVSSLTNGRNQRFSRDRDQALAVRSLLQWGIDPTIKDRKGLSAVHYCCREDNLPCLVEFIKHFNKDSDSLVGLKTFSDRNALHIACVHGSMQCAYLLTRWDADLPTDRNLKNAKDKYGKFPSLLLPSKIQTSIMDTLWDISFNGYASRIIEYVNSMHGSFNHELSSLWEDIDITDQDLLSATAKSKKYGDIWMINGIDSKSRCMRWSALHFCLYGWVKQKAAQGDKSAKRALGLNVTTTKEKRSTNYSDVMSTLLKCRAFVDSLDYKCRTPLMYAASANLMDAVNILINEGSDVNSTDLNGNSPLHYAYAFGCTSVVVLLEAKGASNDIENLSSFTPIDMAGKFNTFLPIFTC